MAHLFLLYIDYSSSHDNKMLQSDRDLLLLADWGSRGRPRCARPATKWDAAFGHQLKLQRIRMGMSQAELSSACGVKLTIINRRETGVVPIQTSLAARISIVFGYPSEDSCSWFVKTCGESPDQQGRAIAAAREAAGLSRIELQRHLRSDLEYDSESLTVHKLWIIANALDLVTDQEHWLLSAASEADRLTPSRGKAHAPCA